MITKFASPLNVLGALSVLAALAFFFAGTANLGAVGHVVAAYHKFGRGQLLRFLLGALEVAGAAGLLIPRFRFYAALLLTTLMVGAILTYMLDARGSLAVSLLFVALATTVGWLSGPKNA